MRDIAWLVGEALTQAAAALPDNALNEAPLLKNIGLYRSALTGVDMSLYNSTMRRSKLVQSICDQRVELQGGVQK